MSLLSSPQGTPERVWSLVAGLAALGGTSARANYDALLNPGYERDGTEVKAAATLAANAHSAALSLGLVDSARDPVSLLAELPDSFVCFADLVHDRLIGLSSGDGDAVILEGYAWMVAECDRQNGMEWIYQTGREEFADKANAGLTGKEMNSTKAVAWRRWLAFLGLGVPMPTERSDPDFPSPAMRILRELERAEIAAGSTLQAAELVALIARRMPYLDRGRLFTQACQRIGHAAPANRLTPLLSAALRDLHDDQSLRLVPSGDAADRVRLSDDASHAIDAFTTVIISPRVAS